MSSANASEKPTFTAEPSGRLPSRSNRIASELAAIPAAPNAAASAAASCDSRINIDNPSPRSMKSRL